jgi:hypothetical protein
MSSPNNFSEVRLERGDLVDRIKNYTQRDWVAACKRLGLYVRTDAGKGAHCAVYKDDIWPPINSSSCILTLPPTMYPNIQRNQLKKIVGYGLESNKYEEKDVWKALKVKF